jgi:hypothetical protein
MQTVAGVADGTVTNATTMAAPQKLLWHKTKLQLNIRSRRNMRNKLLFYNFIFVYAASFGMFSFVYFICRFLNIDLILNFSDLMVCAAIFGTISFIYFLLKFNRNK